MLTIDKDHLWLPHILKLFIVTLSLKNKFVSIVVKRIANFSVFMVLLDSGRRRPYVLWNISMFLQIKQSSVLCVFIATARKERKNMENQRQSEKMVSRVSVFWTWKKKKVFLHNHRRVFFFFKKVEEYGKMSSSSVF